jgi:tetratricopeptide (TPR) repeat protein
MLSEVIKAAHSAVKREDWNRAWMLCNAALNEDPDKAESLYLMGATLRASGNLGMAYQLLRRALAQEQKQVNLWMTFAATLHDLNRWDEAREAMLVAHKLVPNDAMPLANIGATYVQQGQWREAMDYCTRAIKMDPDNHVARISRNFAYLSIGRWTDAWEDSAWLYGRHLPVRVYNPKEHEEPTWDGTKGMVVAVQADQGVGDILMFSQCLADMAKDCKEVVLEVPGRLVNLLRRSFPQITVEGTLKSPVQSWAAARIGTENQIQAHVHISHLGKWYRKLDKEFPRKPYLVLDQEQVDWWKAWLSKYPKPWTGIAWHGGIQHTQAYRRSMSLQDMAPIINSGGTIFDLSYVDNRMEVSRWNVDNKVQIVIPKINAEEFDATASFIAALDDVVTVTTTVAHVCGAMGKKAHVLVPSVPQWRYAYRYEDGTSMVWYPPDSVKLYRQVEGEDGWSPTVRRAARALIASRK